MVCYRLIIVVSTISFIVRTSVATERLLKSSKGDKSDKKSKDTDFPTFFPTFFPTDDPGPPPTKNPTKNPTRRPTKNPTKNPTRRPSRSPTSPPTKAPTSPPTKAPTSSPTTTPTSSPTTTPTSSPTTTPTSSLTKTPTSSPTKTPTSSPTNEPTNNPTESPTVSPNFKRLFLQNKEDPSDAIAFFDEAVNGKIVTFTDDEGRCGEIVCVAKEHDPSCVRTKNDFELFPNSNGDISRAKGSNTFTTTPNIFAKKKDCCANPTCANTYIETEPFAVSTSSSSNNLLFQIEAESFVIEAPFQSWIEAVVALYDDSDDALLQSFVFRGEDDVVKFREEFTGVQDGTYYFRFFPAAYDFKTKNKLKYKFRIKRFEYFIAETI